MDYYLNNSLSTQILFTSFTLILITSLFTYWTTFLLAFSILIFIIILMIFLFTTILILFISSNYFTIRISHSLFYSHVWYCFTIWIYFILHHHFECLLICIIIIFFLRLSNEHLAAVIETIFSILELPPFCLVQVEGTHLDRVSVKVRNKWIICFTINITM